MLLIMHCSDSTLNKKDKTMEKISAVKIVSLTDFIQLRSHAILSSQKALAYRVLMPLESDG